MDMTEIVALVNDHGFNEISPTTKVAIANDVIYDICSREPWPFLETNATWTFDGSNPYPTQSTAGVRSILSIHNNTVDAGVYPLRIDRVETFTGGELTLSGTPTRYWFDNSNKQVRFWPVPLSSDTVAVRYLKIPSEVTDSTTEANIIIPAPHHAVIWTGMLKHLHALDDDPQLAVWYENQYEAKILRMRNELWAQTKYDEPEFIEDHDPLSYHNYYYID